MLGIVGSPKRGGNTERLISEALRVLRDEGIETEMICLADHRVEPCDDCRVCRTGGECPKDADDDFRSIYDRMVDSDGFIVGSPVYYGGPTPQILGLLHRAGHTSRVEGRPFERKVGGPIVVARRAGQNFALAHLLFFFLHQGMIVPGSTYWNMAFGREAGEVEKDEEGLRTIRNFAKNVAWTLRKIRSERSE